MFSGRSRHEYQTARNKERQIPPTDRVNDILPGHEDDPERPSRILSHYLVDNLEDGATYLTTELIWAQTVSGAPKRMKVEDVNELLLFMGHQVEKVMNQPLTRVGRYIIEYPRMEGDEQASGAVFMLGRQLMCYDFKESGDVIEVTGARAVKSVRERFELPAGTRMTASVKMSEPGTVPESHEDLELVNADYVVNTVEPTAEELFTTRIRDAISLYNTLQSDDGSY